MLLAASAAEAAKYALVTNSNDGSRGNLTVYSMSTSGRLTRVASTAVGRGTSCVAAHPNGLYAYVTNQSSSYISVFKVNAGGSLTLLESETTAAGASQIVVEPNGRFAYVANGGIAAYSISQSTGELSPIAAPSASADYIAVSPSGLLYATDPGSSGGSERGQTHAYSIGSNGSLTKVGSYDTTGAYHIAATRWFAFATQAYFNSSWISSYAILPDGSIRHVSEADPGGNGIAVHPSEQFVYTSRSTGSVSRYTVDVAGGLEYVDDVDAGDGPSAIAIEPAGQWVYVANADSSTVSQYSVDQSTGALTFVRNVTAPTRPSWVTIISRLAVRIPKDSVARPTQDGTALDHLRRARECGVAATATMPRGWPRLDSPAAQASDLMKDGGRSWNRHGVKDEHVKAGKIAHGAHRYSFPLGHESPVCVREHPSAASPALARPARNDAPIKSASRGDLS
jgi:6-phosphogluconolactonase (cycloisomerase 2 family)